MKTLKAVLILIPAALATASAASANRIGDAVVVHPVVKAIVKLLNDSNGGTCKTPLADDVSSICFGAAPRVTEPTLVSGGCPFSLTVSCANGASATIRGSDLGVDLVEPASATPAQHKSIYIGLVIQNVVLNSTDSAR